MSPRMVSAREIVGRRIVAFEANASVEGETIRWTMHQPRITLDDGSVLFFVAEEQPDGGDYGVFVGRWIPKEN